MGGRGLKTQTRVLVTQTFLADTAALEAEIFVLVISKLRLLHSIPAELSDMKSRLQLLHLVHKMMIYSHLLTLHDLLSHSHI